MTNTKTAAPAEILTIIDQMGGRQIFAMAFDRLVYSVRGDGQRPASKGPAGASFSIARDLRRAVKATHVVVELEDDDTYTVSLWRNVTGVGFREIMIKRLELVYGDQLRSVVESLTGLRMSLAVAS